jgi:hypothetical protein
MTSLINKVNSGIGNLVQDCKELKHCSQMERGELAKRITSIMLRVSAAAIVTYGTYFFVHDSINIVNRPFPSLCKDIPSPINIDNDVQHLLCTQLALIKATTIGINGLTYAILTTIASMIPLKLHSMIATKPTKPDCKSVHQHF